MLWMANERLDTCTEGKEVNYLKTSSQYFVGWLCLLMRLSYLTILFPAVELNEHRGLQFHFISVHHNCSYLFPAGG